MVKDGRGWFDEPVRHRLAAKRVKTATPQPQRIRTLQLRGPASNERKFQELQTELGDWERRQQGLHYVVDPNDQDTRALLHYKPFSTQIVEMAPQEFLRAASAEHRKGGPWYAESSRDVLMARMKEQLPIDPPFLDVDIKTGRVLGHEGRHRSIAAEELGIKKIPVLLFFRERGSTGLHTPTDAPKTKVLPRSLVPQKMLESVK